MDVLVPVSALAVYGQLGIIALWILSMLTTAIYFPVWGVRKLRGKIATGPAILIRLWPLLAALSVFAFVGAFMLGMADPFVRLGGPTLVSVTIMLSTIAFAIFAILGVRTSIEQRHAAMNQVNYWYCTACSVVHVAVTAYLFWFGVIGLMTWA